MFVNLETGSFLHPLISALLAGPIIAAPFFLIWLFSKGRWMGLGDAKLALGIGWFLGLILGASAVIMSFWVGCAVSLIILAFSRWGNLKSTSKRFTMKTELPFAPFLIFAALLMLFWPLDILMLGTWLR